MSVRLLRDPGHLLAFGFGSGLARYAPGTFGTLAAIPLYLLMKGLPLAVYLLVTAALFAVGVWLCGRTARALGVHDAPSIVWDEVVGYLLVMTAAPDSVWAVVLGFVLFRVFDIAKPWPIRWVDRRVTGGFGIMLDDALAALPALLLLQITARLLA
jgi:phosphatidylglycerophosphatase A